MKMYRILAINPGSTSTKVSLFHNFESVSNKTLRHDSEELSKFESVNDQYMYRKMAVIDYMREEGIESAALDAAVGRGGLLKPLQGGTYAVNEKMLEDLKSYRYGIHASNLGAIIANEIALENGIPAYIVDPPVVNEWEPLARYSGHPEIPRYNAFHALNQKAVARRISAEMGKQYGDLNLIIAHLGGGISVAAHKKGRVIDCNNALEEGPFSPERSGSLPVQRLVDLCFSGRYTKDDIKKMIVGKGGLYAYLHTTDCKLIVERALSGDHYATEVLEAMCYQVAKEIGAFSAILNGEVDRIGLTGGMAFDSHIVKLISERVKFIAPVVVVPGEDEMIALAEGVMRVLVGGEAVREYI